MKRLLIIIIVLIFTPVGIIHAQGEGKVCWIGMGQGAGYGIFHDDGIGRVYLRGAELWGTLSFGMEWKGWRMEAKVPVGAGAYWRKVQMSQPEGYALLPEIRMDVSVRMFSGGGWKVYGGCGLEKTIDFRYLPGLGNNSVGVSDFTVLRVCGRWEWDAGKDWMVLGGMDIAPVAAAFRPGYAYMANYDRTIGDADADFFSGHGLYAAWLCSVGTEVGMYRTLAGGNRAGVVYGWSYFTSRMSEACPHRMDKASHTLRFVLDIKLHER